MLVQVQKTVVRNKQFLSFSSSFTVSAKVLFDLSVTLSPHPSFALLF